MKIAVLSDLTFEPFLKQIRLQEDIQIEHYTYTELIIPEIFKAGNELPDADIFIIHFDAYFFRYSDKYISGILSAVKDLAGKFKGNILVSNNFNSGRSLSLLKNNPGQYGQYIQKSITEVNVILQTSNVYFYDINKIVSGIGLKNAYNFNLGFLYQMPYTKDFISLLSVELITFIRFLSVPEKKVIFSDCDNTLWKGILGEDGLNGIQCDKNAAGILFYHLQEFLLDKKKEGFILGLCSKNNEADVKEAFTKLNMPLKWEDFVVKKINWKNKSENLQEAAKELNVGLDSFIFIDDSEFEIQSIRSQVPDISCFKLSPNYNEFLKLSEEFAFKRKRVTSEDLSKTDQYLAEQQRNNILESSESFDDFIRGLEIKMDITLNNQPDLPRLSQLTEKTNQFNFNKEMFGVASLQDFITQKNLVYGVRVSDKFGDYGLVGLILIEVQQHSARLRNYLLSCRALGRGIEDDFLKFVLQDISKKGLQLKEIIFKETLKNAPAKTFLENLKKTETVVPQ